MAVSEEEVAQIIQAEPHTSLAVRGRKRVRNENSWKKTLENVPEMRANRTCRQGGVM